MTIPGMVVINPSDDIEARAAVKAAYEYVGPVYLRFGRLAVPVINDSPDYKFEIGKGVTLREGSDVTIIATGLMCIRSHWKQLRCWQKTVFMQRSSTSTRSSRWMRSWSLQQQRRPERLLPWRSIPSSADWAAAVAETARRKMLRQRSLRIGVNDVFGESGPAKELLHKYGLDAEGIANRILREMK